MNSITFSTDEYVIRVDYEYMEDVSKIAQFEIERIKGIKKLGASVLSETREWDSIRNVTFRKIDNKIESSHPNAQAAIDYLHSIEKLPLIKKHIGLLYIGKRMVMFGLLRKNKIKELGTMYFPNYDDKINNSKRSQKLRKLRLDYFYNDVCQKARYYFIDNDYSIDSLIISGPNNNKYDFITNFDSTYPFNRKIVKIINSEFSTAFEDSKKYAEEYLQ